MKEMFSSRWCQGSALISNATEETGAGTYALGIKNVLYGMLVTPRAIGMEAMLVIGLLELGSV